MRSLWDSPEAKQTVKIAALYCKKTELWSFFRHWFLSRLIYLIKNIFELQKLSFETTFINLRSFLVPYWEKNGPKGILLRCENQNKIYYLDNQVPKNDPRTMKVFSNISLWCPLVILTIIFILNEKKISLLNL